MQALKNSELKYPARIIMSYCEEQPFSLEMPTDFINKL